MTTATAPAIASTDAKSVIDYGLILEAELIGNGANIHNVKSLLHGYTLAARLIEEGKDQGGELASRMEVYAADLRAAIAANRKGVSGAA